jgi:ABC-2 type transport system ATP-binding protein
MTEFVIQVESLSRAFGAKQALNNISLSIPKGTVLGLVGENGAGKTTLLKHLLELLKTRTGSVRVFGLDPAAEPANVLSRIGYLSENREMPEWMRIDQLMHFQSSFYPDWDHDYATELVDMFELKTNQRIRTRAAGSRGAAAGDCSSSGTAVAGRTVVGTRPGCSPRHSGGHYSDSR